MSCFRPDSASSILATHSIIRLSITFYKSIYSAYFLFLTIKNGNKIRISHEILKHGDFYNMISRVKREIAISKKLHSMI